MLRMYWDGETRPAVEAPVGRLLRQLLRRAERGRQPAGRRRGRRFLQLLLADAVPQVGPDRDREPEREAPEPALLQHRLDQARRACPTTRPTSTPSTARNTPSRKGKDYVILETEGKGHYVGTVLAVRMRSPAWFGEGDEKIYIDGEAKPSIWGTGTEDYFLAAWGLEKSSTPYFGVPFFDYRTIGGHVSSYRWHLARPGRLQHRHQGRRWSTWAGCPRTRIPNTRPRAGTSARTTTPAWPSGTRPGGRPSPRGRRGRTRGACRAWPGPSVRAWDPAAPRRHGPGRRRRRSTSSGRGHLSYRPAGATGAWLEFPIEVGAKEPLRLEVGAVRGPDGGLYQASLDGVKIGEPLDFYADVARGEGVPAARLLAGAGAARPAGSSASGRARGARATPAPSESVRLLERRPRVAEYAHDKDKDWKKDPKLYY